MPNYMLLLHQDSAATPTATAASPDEVMAVIKQYAAWADRMRAEGRLQGGNKLTNDAGRILQPKSGRIAVTDGPYAESKEMIGGYFILSAKDYDEACTVAESCPHLTYGGRIELRQVDQV